MEHPSHVKGSKPKSSKTHTEEPETKEESPHVAQTLYFEKDLISAPVRGSTMRMDWIHIGEGQGILATDDPALGAFLLAKSKSGVGGVSQLTAEDYEKKKAAPVPPQRRVTEPPGPKIRVQGDGPVMEAQRMLRRGQEKEAARDAAGDKPSRPTSPVVENPTSGSVGALEGEP